jgi:hypothetical protein
MVTDLVDRLAILVVFCRFRGMGAANSRSLRSESYVLNFVCNFVRRYTFVPFRRFLGDVRQEFMLELGTDSYTEVVPAPQGGPAVVTREV